jgi:2-oxoglutarate ferredoxin oxidoreductase subunit alpha
MVKLRAEKIERIANDIPPAKVEGDEKGELLVVGWGGTYGTIKTAVEHARKQGKSVSHLHLKHINPLPKNLGEVLYSFKNVLVPEINLGQLIKILRAKYLVPAIGLNKVQGLPYKASEIEEKIDEILGGKK